MLPCFHGQVGGGGGAPLPPPPQMLSHTSFCQSAISANCFETASQHCFGLIWSLIFGGPPDVLPLPAKPLGGCGMALTRSGSRRGPAVGTAGAELCQPGLIHRQICAS